MLLVAWTYFTMKSYQQRGDIKWNHLLKSFLLLEQAVCLTCVQIGAIIIFIRPVTNEKLTCLYYRWLEPYGSICSVVCHCRLELTFEHKPWPCTLLHSSLFPASSLKWSRHLSPGMRTRSDLVPPGSTHTTGLSHRALQAPYYSIYQSQCRWSSQIHAGQVLSPDTSF